MGGGSEGGGERGGKRERQICWREICATKVNERGNIGRRIGSGGVMKENSYRYSC